MTLEGRSESSYLAYLFSGLSWFLFQFSVIYVQKIVVPLLPGYYLLSHNIEGP